MALNKPKFEAPESQEDIVGETTVAQVAEPVAQVGTVVEPANDPAAKPLAVVKSGGMPTATGAKYQGGSMSKLKNVIDPADLAFNTFTRVTVNLGGFKTDKDVELGKVIKVQVMSYNDRYTISPCRPLADTEAGACVRFSLDNKTIDGTGESVTDYLKMLREVNGYEKAASKRYLAIYGFLAEYRKTDPATGANALVEVDPADREIICIQVPPGSLPLFTRFQITDGVKMSAGLLQETDILKLTQGMEVGKEGDYATISFSR